MSSEANCKYCVHWNGYRCILNDGDGLIQKECYFHNTHKKKDTKDQRIAELEEEIKQIEHFKANNGYEEWDTIDLLEDLQSTALQAEDDTDVVRDLLAMFKIDDENKIIEKIKDLQEENAKLQEQIITNRKFYKEQLDKFNYESKEIDNFRERCGYDGWDVKDILLDLYKQATELDKLKEQLKNAIVPKFKVGQGVYYIKDNAGTIKPAEILEVRYNGKRIIYELEYLDNIQEEKYIFATKAEAQKYLEEHK